MKNNERQGFLGRVMFIAFGWIHDCGPNYAMETRCAWARRIFRPRSEGSSSCSARFVFLRASCRRSRIRLRVFPFRLRYVLAGWRWGWPRITRNHARRDHGVADRPRSSGRTRRRADVRRFGERSLW